MKTQGFSLNPLMAHLFVRCFAPVFLLWVCVVPGAIASERATEQVIGPYDVELQRSQWIEMRDGIYLSTDLYFPKTTKENLPVILIRTPYNKNKWDVQDLETRIAAPSIGRLYAKARLFATHGFVVAVQDVRGKYESEGKFDLGRKDADDIYDTIEWLSTRPWSNGRVGTYGCSYQGETQMRQVRSPHPRLAAMIVQAGGGGLGKVGGGFRHYAARNGGVLNLSMTSEWFLSSGSQLYLQRPSWMSRKDFAKFSRLYNPAAGLSDIDFGDLWRRLPTIDMLDPVEMPPNEWREFVSTDLNNPWWNAFGYMTGDEQITVPVLHINSWHDNAPADTMLAFNHFREKAISGDVRGNQYALIGAGLHCSFELATENTVVGELDLGDARFDYVGTYLSWFARWLRPDPSAWKDVPKVQYFAMGRNEWDSAETWPPEGSAFRKIFLHSSGGANTLNGDGTLSFTAPVREPEDRFTYDPDDPVPSLGGPSYHMNSSLGSVDQRPVEERPDVLVYSSTLLADDTEIAGPVTAVLFVSSSAKDTDFTVKLVDVFPDGRALNIQEGVLRMRYRDGFDKSVRMNDGDVYRAEISLQATAYTFRTGHRIRLEISSSNFPRFERNLNTGGNNYDESLGITVVNTVHHSTEFASHILIPFMKTGD